MAFDTHANVAAPIRRPEGQRMVEVRWPTDEEWVERSKGWAINISRLGRGVSQTQVDSTQADWKLYHKIREPESPDLTVDEAGLIVEALTRCEINNVALELDQATVEMTVTGSAKVTHTLRIPTTEEVTRFKRAAVRVIDLPHGKQQLRTNLLAGVELWAKCAQGNDGYSNGIPLIHKDAAVRAVIDACEMQAESPANENF